MQQHLEEMLEEIKSGQAILLDVREIDEWEEGHLTTAKWVPLSTLRNYELPEGQEFDKSKKTYIHCRSGQRVQIAAPILEEIGFGDVIPLSEGFDELVDEGLDEVTS
jgi:rhodanese-related sulfurtransferase